MTKTKTKIKEISENQNESLIYKGKNLIRSKDILCYGNMDDKYIVLLEILDKKEKINGVDIGNKISVALFNRLDLIKNPNVMFLDFCEKSGLYDALETAFSWISRD